VSGFVSKKEERMRRGFTLIELLVVIIIIGVLATLGVMQYQSAIEKSRGAEARQVISTLRSSCAAIRMQDNSTATCTAENLGIDTTGSAAVLVGRIPGTACWPTNYFMYGVATAAPNGMVFTATRCTADGKNPNLPAAAGVVTLTLTTNYNTGADAWTSTGGY
jgi:prepilin-type N-terminal cleavage/methylation domain-containing protein